MGTKTAATGSARERILRTATELFYAEGVRAVGVDTIVQESGVAKTTLYRHFPSKDALVAAFLEERDRVFWDWFEGALRGLRGKPEERLRGLFAAYAEDIGRPDWPGCPFSNTASEFRDPDHPGRQVAAEHKRAVRARIAELAREAGAPDPGGLAEELVLLVDGAYAARQLMGSEGPSARLGAAADALIDARLPET